MGRRELVCILEGYGEERGGEVLTAEPPSVDIVVGCLVWGWSCLDLFQRRLCIVR
jgi:hypothetical protein